MRLSKIKIAGFKSFVDPTTIEFTSNLTGIIGPNGCGKSNTIDAVRWVMGESSAKHLRGGSMEDVIFKGSSSRAPVGKAYVELVFDNSDGTLGGQYAQYSEISTRREVSRDGKSNYYLNGTKCRRRDITDIFLGTGLGPRSYAIIEQGMISRLIESKPEEIRVYIEEAAGISKYKERRRETENRIRHSRENLARLDDLRDEIHKHINRLERQAKTAERYKTLRQDERKLKAELLAVKWKELDFQLNNRERHLQNLQNNVDAETAKQRAVEAEIERHREGHIEATEAMNTVQSAWYNVGSEISRTEQDIQHYKQTRERQSQDLQQVELAWQQATSAIAEDEGRLEQIAKELDEKSPAFDTLKQTAEQSAKRLEDAEQDMRDWQTEWEAFNAELSSNTQTMKVETARKDQTERALVDLRDRLERMQGEHDGLMSSDISADIAKSEAQVKAIDEQRQDLNTRIERIKQGQNDAREANRQWVSELDTLRNDVSKQRGRLASLEALQQAALGKHNEAVSKWLDKHELSNKPRLGECLNVELGWEHAVETVLGNHLEAVCVDGLDAVESWLGSFEQGAIVLADAGTSQAKIENKQSALNGLLADKVTSDIDINSALAGVYVANSLGDALKARSSLNAGESIITQEGVWLGASWLRVAKDPDAQSGVLGREKEMRALNKDIEQLEKAFAKKEEQLKQGRESIQHFETERDTVQAELQKLNNQYSDARAEMSALVMRNEQTLKRREHLSKELSDVQSRIDKESAVIKATEALISTARLALNGKEVERDTLSSKRDHLQRSLDDIRHNAKRDRDTLQQMEVSIQSMRTAKDSADQNLQRMQSQLEHIAKRKDELSSHTDEGDAPIQTMQEKLEKLLQERVELDKQMSDARTKADELDQALRKKEKQRQELEQAVQEQRNAYQQEQINAQETKIRCKTTKEQLDETGFAGSDLIEGLEKDISVKTLEQRVSDMAQKISRLGAINLAAIDEFKEQSERKEYLDAQHKDLTDALDTLETAIAKIDKETKSRFKDTYEQVNKRIGEMFPKLFGGGQAYLELTDDDLLNTGVSIMARPPGKRVSNIHLLSGGEKALTAVAMVFAIFELNPAPFCMLDEVDAPLDEANVGRFCEMVREMSSQVQFIFITHNKPAMEMAQQLHGVTMREAGVSRIVAVDVDEAVKMVD